jgi:hypothetical protein
VNGTLVLDWPPEPLYGLIELAVFHPHAELKPIARGTQQHALQQHNVNQQTLSKATVAYRSNVTRYTKVGGRHF